MNLGNLRRDPSAPLRTRTLPNGTLVVEDAYAGTLYLGRTPVAAIKRIRLADAAGPPDKPAAPPPP